MNADISDINKVRSLYEFLKDYSSILQRPALNISQHKTKKYVKDINIDFQENIKLTYPDVFQNDDDEDNIEEPLLCIRKPEFEKCPPPPNAVIRWLTPHWEFYKQNVSHYDALIEPSNNPFYDEIELNNGEHVVYFNDVEGVAELYEQWLEIRHTWVARQKQIEQIRTIFSFFYTVYMDLERDFEGLEFVIANGFLESKMDKSVSYPILSKRVRLEYDVTVDEIKIYDDDLSITEFHTEIITHLKKNDTTLNIDQVSNLKEKLNIHGYHPLDRNETATFFDECIKALTPNGLYVTAGCEIPRIWDTNYNYICYWNPVYILKSKSANSQKFIDEILDELNKKNPECPQHIVEIVAPESITPSEDTEESFENKLASIGGENLEILLSKQANKEQLDIARHLQRPNSNAVVVQGPPGTGKTHTIANLIGHFLAQGKSILVTSYTPKALTVLKEKLPKELQPLCVSVLGDNKAEMERSVNGIDLISQESTTSLQENMTRIANERKAVFEELCEKRKLLFTIRCSECKTINYNGESFSPIDVAKFVANKKTELEHLIPGEIKENIPLPLTRTQLVTLYQSNQEISLEEVGELDCDLPDPKNLISIDDFENYCIQINQALTALNDIKQTEGWNLNFDPSCNTISAKLKLGELFTILNPTETLLDKLLNASKISALEPWMKHAAVAGKENGSGKRMWLLLVAEIEKLQKKIREIR